MNPEIIIIGAGAAGLMAARELGKVEKKVMILEARGRIGGRIFTLNETDFGYPAEGGAEWLHGSAPITKALIKESGLTLIPEDGEIWSNRNGEFKLHKAFIQSNDELKAKLEALKEDMSIADFLEQNFNDKKDRDFKNSILKMVEGYDAADPKLISTFTLRDEWLTKPSMTKILHDHRIKEGYGALLNFLQDECKRYGVEILLNVQVNKIDTTESSITIHASDEKTFNAKKAIMTVPLPVLKDIEFPHQLQEKIGFASKIGFGNAIKVIIKFKTRWWEQSFGKDLSKMAFVLCNEKFLTWWTQYPEINTVLTGWMAGPEAAKYKETASEELLDIALLSLSNVFKISKDILKKEIEYSTVMNWPGDPFTQGSYSYTTFETNDAYEKLTEPYKNILFFAGEALYTGGATATVEGALGSGLETAERIVKTS